MYIACVKKKRDIPLKKDELNKRKKETGFNVIGVLMIGGTVCALSLVGGLLISENQHKNRPQSRSRLPLASNEPHDNVAANSSSDTPNHSPKSPLVSNDPSTNSTKNGFSHIPPTEIPPVAQSLIKNLPDGILEQILDKCELKEIGRFALTSTTFQSTTEHTIVHYKVSKDGLALRNYSQYANDSTIVFTAVKNNGMALRFAGEKMRQHREIVLTAIGMNPWAILYADKSLQTDRDVGILLDPACTYYHNYPRHPNFLSYLQQVNKTEFILDLFPSKEPFTQDDHFWSTLLQWKNYHILIYQQLPQGFFDRNPKIALQLIQKNPEEIFFLPTSVRNTKDILLAVTRSMDKWLWFINFKTPSPDANDIYASLEDPEIVQATIERLKNKTIIGFEFNLQIASAEQERFYNALQNAIRGLSKKDRLKILTLNGYCIQLIKIHPETEDYSIDDDLIFAALKTYPHAAAHFSMENRNNLDFMQKVVAINGLALKFAGQENTDIFYQYSTSSKDLQAKILEIAETAVQNNGLALKYMQSLLQYSPDKEKVRKIVHIAVHQNPDAFEFAYNFRDDPDIAPYVAKHGDGKVFKRLQAHKKYTLYDKEAALAVAKHSGVILKTFANDPEIVLTAVKTTGKALFYMGFLLGGAEEGVAMTEDMIGNDKTPEERMALKKKIREIALTAMQNGGYLEDVPIWLHNDAEVAQTAVKTAPHINVNYALIEKLQTLDQIKKTLGLNQ